MGAAPPVPVPAATFTAPPPPPELPALAAPTAPPTPPAPPAPPLPPAPAPAAPRQVVLTDSDWVRVPQLDYPLAAKRLREEGTVVVKALIDVRGVPRQVTLQRSSGHPRLDQEALAKALTARVKPRTENGVPFEFSILMPLEFKLED
jgi:protein TonB